MQWIDLKKEGPVGVLSMNYEGENRLSTEFCEDLMGAMDVVEADGAIRSIVLVGGEEKYWSTGLHLEYLGKIGVDEVKKFIALLNNMLKRWCVYPKPVVAAINGHAFAAGAILAAHMDYRFMRGDRGWVCLPEVDINIPFLPGMIAILRSVLSPSALRHMALTGKRFNAQEAQNLGFIDGVFSKEELLPKAIEWASFLATKNIAAYAEIKRRMRAEVVRIIEQEDPKYAFSQA